MNGIVILLGFLAVQAGYAQNSPATWPLYGQVLDNHDTPRSGVVVSIPESAVSDTTDRAGRFMFRQMPVGRHEIRAYLPGSALLPVTVQAALPDETALPVIIRLGQRTYTVDEVVVIGSAAASQQQIEDTPAQVDVVTRAEFEHQAATVEEVIASTPSATINSYGGLGSFSEVSLRGSYSNQVQVYIDGMLLNESVGGAVNLGTIPLANVDRVEIWRSGAPGRFGGDAVGGAINIVTRQPENSAGSLSVGYGSFRTITGQGVFGFGPPENRLLVSLDAAASRNDFEYTSDNGTPQNTADDYTTDRRNNAFRSLNGLMKYRRMLGADTILELSEHLMHSRKNLPDTQHILDSDAMLATTKNLFQSRLTWMPSSAPWFEAAPTAHAIISHEHYEDLNGQVGWGEQDNYYDTTSYTAMTPFSFHGDRIGELTLTPVASYESYEPEHTLDTTVPLSSDRIHSGLVGDLALHSPGQLASLTANMRRDRYHSDYEGQAGLFNPEPPEPVTHYFTNVQTGVKIEPHDLVSFRWNYGDNWREPSFYELFGDRGGVVTSPGLKPEHVYRWDAGIRLRLPDWAGRITSRFDVVYFDTRYRDLIQWYTNSYGFIQPANVAGSYVHGTEFIWNMRMFRTLSVRGNWTWQESKVTNSSKSYHEDKQLPNRPGQHGTATVEYTHRRATISWIIDHKGDYYLDRSNQPHMRYPGRTLHDLSVSLAFNDDRLVWRLAAENITDRRTFDMRGMPKPGRSYTTELRYRL